MAAALALTFSCGEPLGPREVGWVTVARFPLEWDSGVNSIYTDSRTIWAVVYEDVYPEQVTRAKIMTYAEGEFRVEYESPPEYEYAELADIAFDRYRARGWAVGHKAEKGKYGLWMLAYDDKLKEWTEVQ